MCGEERDVCLNGFVGVGQNLEAVLVVLVCAGRGSSRNLIQNGAFKIEM